MVATGISTFPQLLFPKFKPTVERSVPNKPINVLFNNRPIKDRTSVYSMRRLTLQPLRQQSPVPQLSRKRLNILSYKTIFSFML